MAHPAGAQGAAGDEHARDRARHRLPHRRHGLQHRPRLHVRRDHQGLDARRAGTPRGHRLLRGGRGRQHRRRSGRPRSSGSPRCPRWRGPTATSTGSAATSSTRTASWSAARAPRPSPSTTTTTPTCSTSPRCSCSTAPGPRAPTRSCSTAARPRRPATEVGDEVTVIAPSGDSVEGARQTFTMAGTAEFNGGGTAGATLLDLLDRGRPGGLPRRQGRLHQRGADRGPRRQPAAAGRRRRAGAAGVVRGRRRATRSRRRRRTRWASSSTSSPSSWWRSP